MTDRDDLAQLIADGLSTDSSNDPFGPFADADDLGDAILDGHFDLRALADAVLAAGWHKTWHKTHTVTTTAELGALSKGAIIRDARGWVAELTPTATGKDCVWWAGNECEDDLSDVVLPALVLWTPEETHDA